MNAPSRFPGESALLDRASEMIRSERIANIHWDALLDRFSVTFTNGTMGLGGSVGEALGDARRRS